MPFENNGQHRHDRVPVNLIKFNLAGPAGAALVKNQENAFPVVYLHLKRSPNKTMNGAARKPLLGHELEKPGFAERFKLNVPIPIFLAVVRGACVIDFITQTFVTLHHEVHDVDNPFAATVAKRHLAGPALDFIVREIYRLGDSDLKRSARKGVRRGSGESCCTH